MSRIDESLHPFITEYVENTMDPKVRIVFEEVMAVNADLRKFVDRVARGRDFLKKYASVIQRKLQASTVYS
jgi:hypothetical protein